MIVTNQLSFVLVIITFCSVPRTDSRSRLKTVKTVHKTYWDDFCIEERVFKPSAKYYDSRQAARDGHKPIKIRGPGFLHDFTYDATGKSNMLVCVNGL